jgi:ABC-type nickel/cobalt efflux system permease component RcnA
MPDWVLSFLSGLQRTAVTGLAAEIRAGGMLTAVLAFALGALHALTPGHGKAALAAYFLGQEAKLATGVRVALSAAFLHVMMGFLAFLVLRFVVSRAPVMTGRGNTQWFAVIGYALILLAGLLMVIQSWRAHGHATNRHMLTAGIGLLPCPLTITVLGFAWAQAAGIMVAVVLVSLASGIAFTIGAVTLLAIVGRRFLGQTVLEKLPHFERWARMLQAVAGAAIVVVAGYAIFTRV